MADALQLIAENKKTKDPYLDLGNCGLSKLPPELLDCDWLETLILGDECDEYDFKKKGWQSKYSKNKGEKNYIKNLPPSLSRLLLLKKLVVSGWVNRYSLSDLSPLKELQNLQLLDVHSTQVSDLSPLKVLQNLQQLSVSGTKVSDLSPLKELKNLQQLSVSSTKVSDLSPLKELKNLQQLNVSGTQVSDLSPLKDLINLQHLDVRSTQVSDLSPLKDLHNLQLLSFRLTQVSDLSPLKDLHNLQGLDFSEAQVSDLSPLKELINLQGLDFFEAQVSDLSPLKELINLQHLRGSSERVSDLSPLKELINLQHLEVSFTQVSDLSPLKELHNLQELWVFSERVSDLSPLKELINLQHLSVSMQVSDLSPLKDLQNLQSLFVRNTQVSDLSPLKDMLNLQYLGVSSTQVSDLSPLKDMLNLQHLDAFSTQVSDLSPLKDLINLQRLDVHDTQVSDLSPLKHLSNLYEINCKDCPIKTVPPEIAFSGDVQLIREYLLSNPDTPFNEIKLILTGNTEAGKTNLADFLCLGEGFQFQAAHDSTHGILVRRWDIGPGLLPRDTALDRLSVNIWDFGGQDFYHGTHSMFFRQGAVFALLWVKDKTKEKHYGKAAAGNQFVCFPEDYWLDNIRHHAFDSPVLCIQNKTDRDGVAVLPEAWLRRYNIPANEVFYLSIQKAALELDSESADDWRSFQRKLVRRLAEIPAREEIKIKGEWLQLRDFIRELQQLGTKPSSGNPFSKVSPERPYQTLAEFEQCCEEVLPDFVQFAKTFLHLFDQRGVLIHYAGHEKLGGHVFLHPDWVVRKIYTLLDKELWEQKEGKFDRAYAQERLGDDTGLLLELMLEFGIVYPEPRKADTFVAVQYLPPFHAQGDADFAYAKKLTVPALKIRLPLFHQQRILRQLIVRLGSDKVYEQRLLRRDCILLGAADGSLIRIEGQQDESRGVIIVYAEKEEWAVQMWLEVLMLYFSSFSLFDISPALRPGAKIDQTIESYLKKVRRYFDSDGEAKDFLRDIDEVKRSMGIRGGDLLMMISIQSSKLPNKKQVAQIWGLLFREKLEHARLDWKAVEETENYPQPHGKQFEQTERMFEAYSANCFVSADDKNWVEFSTLLKNAAKSNVPGINGETTEIKPYLPYLKALGCDMEKQPLKVFFSYSKDDKAFLEDFKKHLSALRRTKHIELWDDSKIRPGEEWDDSIKTALKEADIIFLLLSKSFIDTDYIWEIEVKEAMRRHEAGEAIVVPIKAKSCDWKGLPFSKLQGLPRKDAVIDTAPNADALWTEVASEVRALIEDFWTRKFV